MLSTGHVIVCGLDHLGLRTIDELRMRDEAVVGDRSETPITRSG